MSFYKFSPAIEKSKVGDFPQCQKMSNGYDVESANSLYKVDWSNKLVADVNLDSFELSKAAKLTDVISSVTVNSQAGMLVSNRLSQTMEGLSLPDETQWHSAKVVYKGEVRTNYKLLSIYNLGLDYIDYAGSTFQRKSFFDYKNVSEIQFQNKLDYLKKLEMDRASGDLCSYEPLELKLLLDIIPFDLVRISLGIEGFLVSQNMFSRLNSSGFTGFDLTTLDRFDFIKS